MKVLILGADGFVGRHLCYALRRAGIGLVACARRSKRLRAMGFETRDIDLTNEAAASAAFWADQLEDITHVVNCAGLLHAAEDTMHKVHVESPRALYQAAARRPILLLSAVGIDTSETAFARHRRAGEEVALAQGACVLRAGLILGDTSWGGSSLGRALATFPFRIPVVGDGDQPINPIHVDDLSTQIIALLKKPRRAETLETGGPETTTQARMLASYRAWFGLPPRPPLKLSVSLSRFLGRIGDALRLGPISTTSVDQLQHGVLAKPDPSLPPVRPFSEFIATRPPGTQDLWHARLYLLAPLIRLVLAALWLVSGLVGLLMPLASLAAAQEATGLPDSLFLLLARGGGVCDLLLALALLRNWRPRLTAGLQLILVGTYTLGLTLLAPALWLLPFGGMLKNLPILALLLVHLALEDSR